jgi:hypothetical protein
MATSLLYPIRRLRGLVAAIARLGWRYWFRAYEGF